MRSYGNTGNGGGASGYGVPLPTAPRPIRERSPLKPSPVWGDSPPPSQETIERLLRNGHAKRDPSNPSVVRLKRKRASVRNPASKGPAPTFDVEGMLAKARTGQYTRAQLAREYDVHRQTIRRQLERHGVTVPNGHDAVAQTAAEVRAECVRRYLDGETIPRIGAAIGKNEQIVRRHIRMANVPLRDDRSNWRMTEDDRRAIVVAYLESGSLLAEASRATGRDRKTVKKVISEWRASLEAEKSA